MFHFQEFKYQNKSAGNEASTNEVLSLLTVIDPSQQKFVQRVKHSFPITSKSVKIEGSKEALDGFKTITNRKMDLELTPLDLQNITFSTNNRKHQMTFTVNKQNVSTCYEAKREFLDKNYDLNDYADFLLDRKEEPILKDTLTKAMQSTKIKNKKAKYRFIEDNQELYLRSIVSAGRYKFYDNAIVLYMAFASVNDLVAQLGKNFYVENMTVTDSKLWISFLEKEATSIGKGITIQTGIMLNNSELGDGAARFTAYYLIKDKKGHIVKGLDESITNINHGYNPLSIEQGLQNLKNFNTNRQDIVNAAKKINWSHRLTEDDVLTIIDLITHHLGNNVPNNIKTMLNQTLNAVDVVNKTYHLMDILGKLQPFIDNNDKNIQLILEAKVSQWSTYFTNK
ncbi:hypothetical protein [Lactobacillus intestinalis]|uniref:hypothetical protein n=1 Tax=Lactobacillus intestinalis TaxID=151781 RepID=UPI00260A3E3B|nr:hypothetical protein [Lactobacillus intestinalis]